jgi:two-component system phosphate regulon sensor histidine kinase PhoR
VSTGETESGLERLKAARHEVLILAAALGVPLGFLIAADTVTRPAALLIFIAALAAQIGLILARTPAPAVPPAPGEAASQPGPVEPTRDAALVDALVESFPDPVILLDEDQRVLFANSAARATLTGLRAGASIAFGVRVPELLDALRKAATTREAARVEFSERVPVDRWYEALVCAVERPGDRPSGRGPLFLVVVRDLTQQRRIERMRADFVANASHELRTPLASLSGFIETLQGSARNDAPARERFLGIMRVQASRMARLIDDLLSLSRIELNAHIRPRDTVDIAAILGHVVDTLQPLARDRATAIRVDTGNEPLLVTGDRDELIRLFENLIENALKYGGDGKRVEVSASAGHALPRGRDGVRVKVRDFGAGIAPEHLPRLTERFYRVNVGQSREAGGTGLGLAIVKHILNRHEGELQIESTVGEGSCFVVVLPAG